MDPEILHCAYLDDPLESMRNQSSPWEQYFHDGFLSEEQYNCLSQFAGSHNDSGSLAVLLDVFPTIQQPQVLKYILVVIHDLLQYNFEIFRKIEPRKIVQFKQYLIDLLVDSTDPWLGLLAVKVLVLYFALLQPKNLEEQRNFISAFLVYMQTIIQSGQSERVLCTIQLLAFLLQRFPAFRLYLVKISPILLSILIALLSKDSLHFQIQYTILFSLWLLSFEPEIAAILKDFDTLPVITEICRNSSKEKIIRICFAIFRNLLEYAYNENISIMIGCKILELSMSVESRKFSDEEIMLDVKFVRETLDHVYQSLSTFEEYASEVRSGQLFWSASHKSEVFWKQNVREFDSNGHEILKKLIFIVEDSDQPASTRAIAVHDLGQYMKYNPKGRRWLDEFGGKASMMRLIADPDPSVKYEALMALQKYMVNRW